MFPSFRDKQPKDNLRYSNLRHGHFQPDHYTMSRHHIYIRYSLPSEGATHVDGIAASYHILLSLFIISHSSLHTDTLLI